MLRLPAAAVEASPGSVDGGILAAARALVEMLDAVGRHDQVATRSGWSSSSGRLRLPGLAEAAGVAEGECGADECEVAEGLGEVSELAVVVRVVFFREQADVVTEVE